jgi:hypothetical protein
MLTLSIGSSWLEFVASDDIEQREETPRSSLIRHWEPHTLVICSRVVNVGTSTLHFQEL